MKFLDACALVLRPVRNLAGTVAVVYVKATTTLTFHIGTNVNGLMVAKLANAPLRTVRFDVNRALVHLRVVVLLLPALQATCQNLGTRDQSGQAFGLVSDETEAFALRLWVV